LQAPYRIKESRTSAALWGEYYKAKAERVIDMGEPEQSDDMAGLKEQLKREELEALFMDVPWPPSYNPKMFEWLGDVVRHRFDLCEALKDLHFLEICNKNQQMTIADLQGRLASTSSVAANNNKDTLPEATIHDLQTKVEQLKRDMLTRNNELLERNEHQLATIMQLRQLEENVRRERDLAERTLARIARVVGVQESYPKPDVVLIAVEDWATERRADYDYMEKERNKWKTDYDVLLAERAADLEADLVEQKKLIRALKVIGIITQRHTHGKISEEEATALEDLSNFRPFQAEAAGDKPSITTVVKPREVDMLEVDIDRDALWASQYNRGVFDKLVNHLEGKMAWAVDIVRHAKKMVEAFDKRDIAAYTTLDGIGDEDEEADDALDNLIEIVRACFHIQEPDFDDVDVRKSVPALSAPSLSSEALAEALERGGMTASIQREDDNIAEDYHTAGDGTEAATAMPPAGDRVQLLAGDQAVVAQQPPEFDENADPVWEW
jgi:hypothetical protein